MVYGSKMILKIYSQSKMEASHTILYLCATNDTANLRKPKLHHVVQQIYSTSEENSYVNHYNGESLVNDVSKNHCNVNLRDDFVTHCGYRQGQFDAVVSEYCPVVESLSLLDNNFMQRVKFILKQEGYFLLQVNQIDDLKQNLTTVKRTGITFRDTDGSVTTCQPFRPQWTIFFERNGFVLDGCIVESRNYEKNEQTGDLQLKEKTFYKLKKQ